MVEAVRIALSLSRKIEIVSQFNHFRHSVVISQCAKSYSLEQVIEIICEYCMIVKCLILISQDNFHTSSNRFFEYK